MPYSTKSTRKQTLAFLLLPCSLLSSMQLQAMDARSAALGGSSIANGAGVHGVLENPSTLMRLKRENQRLHIHLGASVDIRDQGELIQTISDEEDLATDIEAEIDNLSGRSIDCDVLTATADTVCVSGTQSLGDLAGRVINVFNDVDGQPIEGTAATDIGFAFSGSRFPFAIHYKAAVTVYGRASIAEADRNYVGSFDEILSDNELTFGELTSSEYVDIDPLTQTLTVVQPEDTLESSFASSALLRQQVGFSFATSLPLMGLHIDFGVTPKFSSFRAGNLEGSVNEQFDDSAVSYEDQFEESEVTASSTTIDVGVSAKLALVPLRVSAVARNLIPESVTTNEGFKFETTPQLIVGAAFSLPMVTVTADLALNSAKVDNLETQIIAVGAELGTALLRFRAGISHDNARDADATALSLGVSLGPLHVGGRVTGASSAQAGAQLAFSF